MPQASVSCSAGSAATGDVVGATAGDGGTTFDA